MPKPLIGIALSLWLAGHATAQTRTQRQSAPRETGRTGAYNEPAATMKGTLKKFSGKEMMISGEGEEIVRIRLTRKTRFLKGGNSIKPSEIPIGSDLLIDVGKDPDLNPQAINVIVAAPALEQPQPSAADPAQAQPK